MNMNEKLDNFPAHKVPVAVVIADDLTGACDAGVQFAHCGLSSVVELAASNAPIDAEVRIANSRSRHESPEAAAKEVERLTRRMACLLYTSATRNAITRPSNRRMRSRAERCSRGWAQPARPRSWGPRTPALGVSAALSQHRYPEPRTTT